MQRQFRKDTFFISCKLDTGYLKDMTICALCSECNWKIQSFWRRGLNLHQTLKILTSTSLKWILGVLVLFDIMILLRRFCSGLFDCKLVFQKLFKNFKLLNYLLSFVVCWSNYNIFYITQVIPLENKSYLSTFHWHI